MAWRIQIPKDESTALLFFVRINGSEFERLLSAISDIKPTLYVGHFFRSVIRKADLGQYDNAFDGLVNLNGIFNAAYARGESASKIAVDLAAELQSKEDLSPADEQIFAQRMEQLLLSRNIALVSQAFAASVDGRNLLQRFSISTELFPLYNVTNASTTMLGGTIIHELILSLSADEKDFSVTCSVDLDDLMELRRQIDRVMEKRSALRKSLEESNLTVVGDLSDASELEG